MIGAPKSDSSLRTIPLPAQIAVLCRHMQPADPEAYVLTGGPAYMEPRTLQYRLKRYTAACGLEGVHAHTLRHTFATRAIESGFELKSLSEVLGHATTAITMERYVHSTLCRRLGAHGIPLCPQPLDEAAWQCVHEAFADGLFLCGKNAQESLSMARQIRQRVPGVPLFLGGGATGDNVRVLLQEYDAVCVATWIKNGRHGAIRSTRIAHVILWSRPLWQR